MEDFIKEESSAKHPYVAYKVFMEDLESIAQICNNKCFRDYTRMNLSSSEKLCLEKCIFKTLEMNDILADDYSNLMNEYESNKNNK